MNDMSAGCGSETMNPNPTTEHVAIENAIDVIIDLRDEVAKLRRTVAAHDWRVRELEDGIRNAHAETRRVVEDARSMERDRDNALDDLKYEKARTREARNG